MKKRLICMLLSVLMIVSLFAGTSVSASAETVSYSTMTYRMASGDYVLRICQRLGLNYYVCKTAIMKLNNIQEGQWNKLPVGKLLTLPSTDADAVVITTGHGSTAATSTTTAATTAAATTIASATPTNATVSASSSGDPIWYWIVPYDMRTGETIADAMNALGMEGNAFRDSIQKINQIKDWGSSRTDNTILLPTFYPPSSNFSRIAVYAHVMRAGETPANVVASRGLNYTKLKPILDILNEKYGGVANVQTGQRLFYPIATTGTVYGRGADGNYGLMSGLNSADGTVEFYVNGSRVLSAKAGTTVKYVLKPAKGKAVKDIVLKFANGQADMFLTGDSFTMPSCDVRLEASFQSGHSITLQPNYEGRAAARVDGVNVSSAAKGARVMVVSTDPSLEIKELYVNYTTLTGAKREQVTNIDQGFVMPDYDVTIEVVLGPVQTYNLFVIDDGVNDARIGQAINANGKFSLQVNDVKVTSAARGTEVKIVFEPDPGYTVGAVWVFNHNANVPVGVFNNTFTMPNRDIDVGVRFDPKGNNILINPVEGGQFYVTLNAADKNPSTIANRNANAVDEAQTNQRVFINWVPEVAGGPYAMSNVPDDFVVTRNSDGLRIPVTIDANGVWFRMPAGGATVTGGVVPAAQTYTARVFLDGVQIPANQFKDVSFYTKGDNAAERSEFRDGSGVEVKTGANTVATTVGEYIKLTYSGGEHVSLIRYEVWDAAEANMLAEETNQANKSDHCFKMPGQNVVIRAFFSSSVVKIDAKDITVKSGSGTVGVMGLFTPGADPADPNSWNTVAGVNVGDPFAISVSPSEGYFFDTANAATKLRVVRKDNGGEIPLVQDGNANPVQSNDGEWIYRYTAMPDCGVKVEVVFDKIVYWVQLNTQDEDGNALNAAGYWKFTVNKKDNLVENSVTDAFIEYGDTVTISLTEAGASKFTFVNSIINNVTSKDTSFKLSGALARAAENLNNQGQPLVVTLTLKEKALSGTKNPIKLAASYNAAGRGAAGFAITQASPYKPRAVDPTALVTEAYAGDTVAVVPQPVTPAKYQVSRIRVNYNSSHYEDLDLTNPVDINGENGYTFVMPEGGYKSIVVYFDPVLYNLTVDKNPTDASKGLFQVSYNDGTTTGDVLFAGSFKQVPYGSTVKITLTKPGTDAKLKINGINITPDTDGSAAASKKPTTDPATTYTFTMPAEDTTVTVNLVDKDGGTTGVPKGDPDPVQVELDSTKGVNFYDENGALEFKPMSGSTMTAELKPPLAAGKKLDGPIQLKDKNGQVVAEIEPGVPFEVPYVDAADQPLTPSFTAVKKQYKMRILVDNAPDSYELSVNGQIINAGITINEMVEYGDTVNISVKDSAREINSVVEWPSWTVSTGSNPQTASGALEPDASVEDGAVVDITIKFDLPKYTLPTTVTVNGSVTCSLTYYSDPSMDSSSDITTTATSTGVEAGETVYVKSSIGADWYASSNITFKNGTSEVASVADGGGFQVTAKATSAECTAEQKTVSAKIDAKYIGGGDASDRITVAPSKLTGLVNGDKLTIEVPSSDNATISITDGTGYTATVKNTGRRYEVAIDTSAVENNGTVTVEVDVTKPKYTLDNVDDASTPVEFFSKSDASTSSKITGPVEEGKKVYFKSAHTDSSKYASTFKIGDKTFTPDAKGVFGPYEVKANVAAASMHVTLEDKLVTVTLNCVKEDLSAADATKVQLVFKSTPQPGNTAVNVKNGETVTINTTSGMQLVNVSSSDITPGTPTATSVTCTVNTGNVANGGTVTINVIVKEP